MAKPSVDISISIANFNTRELLKNCLKSIVTNTNGLRVEIIVVDNASKDGSQDMVKENFPKVKLIRNKENLFFSKAHNLAFAKSNGQYFLVLNSDTFIKKGVLKKLFIFMEKHHHIAALSCKQIDGNGRLDSTCSRFPTPFTELFESNLIGQIFRNKGLLNKYRYTNWKRNTLKQVDVIGGSFMLVKKGVIEKIGLFDENFLLFYSDLDLCLRIKQARFKIYHYPKTTIIHLRSQTVQQLNKWQLANVSLADMFYYYRKHFGVLWWLFMWIVYRPNWVYWRLKSFN